MKELGGKSHQERNKDCLSWVNKSSVIPKPGKFPVKRKPLWSDYIRLCEEKPPKRHLQKKSKYSETL